MALLITVATLCSIPENRNISVKNQEVSNRATEVAFKLNKIKDFPPHIKFDPCCNFYNALFYAFPMSQPPHLQVITKRFFYGRQFYNFAGGMNSATQQRPRVLTRELLFCVLFFWGWVVKRGRDQSGRNIKVKKRGPKIDLLLEYETFCQFCSFFDCDGSSKLERWERRGEGKQN